MSELELKLLKENNRLLELNSNLLKENNRLLSLLLQSKSETKRTNTPQRNFTNDEILENFENSEFFKTAKELHDDFSKLFGDCPYSVNLLGKLLKNNLDSSKVKKINNKAMFRIKVFGS
jgi:hypothetical protein